MYAYSLKCILILLLLWCPNLAWASEKTDSLLGPFVSVFGSSGVVIKKTQQEKQFSLTILSAFHVVDQIMDDDAKVTIGLHNFSPTGKITKTINHKGKLSKLNKLLDFAIITCVTEIDYPVAKLPTLAKLKDSSVLDTIYSVGSPTNTGIWASQGVIASLDINIAEPFFGHTAVSYFGSSGGPVYNEDYEVIGINLRLGPGINGPLEGMVYACPLNQIFDSLTEKEKSEYLLLE